MNVRQREPRLEIPELRALAKGAPCLIQIPDVCRQESETTVWCHSNLGEHGKGKGLKAHDNFGAFGCFRCHQAIDGTSFLTHEDKDYYMRRAIDRTAFYLWRNGLIQVAK